MEKIVEPVLVKKHPPIGMTAAQKRLAEKTIKERYSQLTRAVARAQECAADTIKTCPSAYSIKNWLTGDDDNNDEDQEEVWGKCELRSEALALRKSVLAFLRKADKLRKNEDAVVSRLEQKLKATTYALNQDASEAVIRVNFNGASEDMLDFLASLPTVPGILADVSRVLPKSALSAIKTLPQDI